VTRGRPHLLPGVSHQRRERARRVDAFGPERALLREGDERDEREVAALGRVGEAERVVGAAVACGAQVVARGLAPGRDGARHVGVGRGHQTLDLFGVEREVESLPRSVFGQRRVARDDGPAHLCVAESRRAQRPAQQTRVEGDLETEADRLTRARLEVYDRGRAALAVARDLDEVCASLALPAADPPPERRLVVADAPLGLARDRVGEAFGVGVGHVAHFDARGQLLDHRALEPLPLA
jgi:hypothetical protein